MEAFPDLKGQAPLRLRDRPEELAWACLFLTSKVRLHCGNLPETVTRRCGHGAFPDLKGQAPLRLRHRARMQRDRRRLFLTSKVRLHCGLTDQAVEEPARQGLFLTSKVRLHCGWSRSPSAGAGGPLFLTSKVRLHCGWSTMA